MKKLDKATKVLAKIVEVAHWIGVVGMLVGAVLLAVMGEKAVIGDVAAGEQVSAYGFELTVANMAGELDLTAMTVFLVGGALVMGLMAMVFRNVYLILKKSENATPFQKDNVRMVREIGIFLIAQPIVGLALSTIARLLLGPEAVEGSVNMNGILVGLVVLSLSQFFARGMELEADVDGLV